MPGQCWISDTESELGIGIVKQEDGRRVTVLYPAAGEERTYACANAPLSRVRYERGDWLRTADERDLQVTKVVERDGRLLYQTVDSQGVESDIVEAELDSFARFSRPRDRLLAGQVDRNSDFELRVASMHHRRTHERSDGHGLLGPRVQLLEHQLFIAREVASRHAPRVLLADEVGLGKTIEAGLILHHQLVCGRVDRALVLVPDGLVLQWLVEMLRRFNLRFTVLDEERCIALEASEEGNPFESAQLVICSLRLLSMDETRAEQALAAGWDLLIVDEAHHLAWSESESSPGYACVEALAGATPGVLLLTATPEQLGADSHFARLRLLDPDRYPNLGQFREEQAAYEPVRRLIDDVLEIDFTTDSSGKAAVDAALAEFIGRAPDNILAHADDAEAFDAARNIAVGELLDRHGTGRVLFRNTREAVGGFPGRSLQAHPLAPPEEFDQTALTVLDRLQPETALGDGWESVDPRVAWLTEWLQANRGEKLLVICARPDTAVDLETHLRLREGIRSASFHEGMHLVARDRAAAYFAETENGAQVLVCSEIGSEGRNFQFAGHLVLFDLPLNPDLLEQRIGRLDRIGQTRTVCIHVPYFEVGAQAALLRWYHEGVDAFERSCPVGRALYEEFGETLELVLSAGPGGTGPALDDLINDTRARTETLLESLSQGRDRLLERNSCDPIRAAEIVQIVASDARPSELSAYLDRVFDHFGVECERHGLHSIVVRPGSHMTVPVFPALPEDGLTGTFSRAEALEREDMSFLTWEHPLVAGAVDLILTGEFGNTALASGKIPGMAEGALLLESYFSIHCAAPRSYQLGRYLPQALLRVVCGSVSTQAVEELPPQELERHLERVPTRVAQQVVRHAREDISKLLGQAEERAQAQRAELVDDAQATAALLHDAEIDRLLALAQVNPNIRETEIEAAKCRRVELHALLGAAQLRLEALRVVVTT